MSNTILHKCVICLKNNSWFIKNILINVLILSFSLSCYAHEEPTKTLFEKKEKEQQKKQITNSNIKTITIWKFIFEKEQQTEAKNKAFVMGYDKSGNLSFIEAYKNDSLSEKAEYSYDSHGNMLTDFDLTAKGEILEKNFFTFDKEGRVISGISKNDHDSLTGSFIIFQSADKNSIEFIKYDANNKSEYKLLYKYPGDYDKFDYIEAIKYDSTGKMMMTVKKEYNPEGKPIKKIILDSNQKLSYYFIYGYDNMGNNTMITKKTAEDSIVWEDYYTFDSNGNCLEMKSFDNKKVLKIHQIYTIEYYQK